MKRIFTIVTLLFSLSTAVTYAQNTIRTDVSEAYIEKLINVAKANYPRVKFYGSKVTVAQNNVKKAKVGYLEPFTVSYIYQPNNTLNLYQSVDNSTGSTNNRQSLFNGAQIGVFFSLGSFLQKPYAVKQAKSEYTQATLEEEEYLITLSTNIKKRYYTYLQRLASLKIQTQSAIDAENVFKDIKYKFEKGEETFDSYNKARITLAQQNETKITAEVALFTAKAELEELLGDKIENIK